MLQYIALSRFEWELLIVKIKIQKNRILFQEIIFLWPVYRYKYIVCLDICCWRYIVELYFVNYIWLKLILQDAMMAALIENNVYLVLKLVEECNGLSKLFDLDYLWDLYKIVSYARPELKRLFRQMSFGYIIFVVLKQNNCKLRTCTA